VSAPTQVRIALVDTGDHHTVRSCLAADMDAAWPMVRAWMSLPDTCAGRTEVDLRIVGHPLALPGLVVA
jgi:hypothetical protein